MRPAAEYFLSFILYLSSSRSRLMLHSFLDNFFGVYYTVSRYETARKGSSTRRAAAKRGDGRCKSSRRRRRSRPGAPALKSSKPRRRPTVSGAGAFRAAECGGDPESRWYHGHSFALSLSAQGVFLLWAIIWEGSTWTSSITERPQRIWRS